MIFIDGLADEIIKRGLGIKCGNRLICLLLFADDIVLLAQSKEDLEIMLKIAYDYSLRWRFKFNLEKCAVVIFDNNSEPMPLVYGSCVSECICGQHYRFGTQWIKEALSYKYLGVELDKCLSFKDFKARMLGKARWNMLRIWYLGIRTGFLSTKASLNLWETLVRTLWNMARRSGGMKCG